MGEEGGVCPKRAPEQHGEATPSATAVPCVTASGLGADGPCHPALSLPGAWGHHAIMVTLGTSPALRPRMGTASLPHPTGCPNPIDNRGHEDVTVPRDVGQEDAQTLLGHFPGGEAGV